MLRVANPHSQKCSFKSTATTTDRAMAVAASPFQLPGVAVIHNAKHPLFISEVQRYSSAMQKIRMERIGGRGKKGGKKKKGLTSILSVQ